MRAMPFSKSAAGLCAAFAGALWLWAAAAEARNPNGVAVIIGNADYEHRDVPDVEFAARDAEAFERWVVGSLGFDPENVIRATNATRREMFDLLGKRGDPRGDLWAYLDPDGGGEVVVFYSGHGVPGVDDGRGYLLPVDADPKAAAQDGYPIDLLFENLGGLAEADTVRVFLDACFSGGSDAGGLVADASPVFVTAALPEELTGKVTALTAAQGSEIASWDREARHGLFTTHLLDALYGGGDADGDGAVTAAEAKAYLDKHMTRAARREYRRIQNAGLMGGEGAVLARAPDGAFTPRPDLDAPARPAGTAKAQADATDDGAAEWAAALESPTRPEPDSSAPAGDDIMRDAEAAPEPVDEATAIELDKLALGIEMAFRGAEYPKVLEYAGKFAALGGALSDEAEGMLGVAREVESEKVALAMDRAFEAQDFPEVLARAAELEALGGAVPPRARYFAGVGHFHAERFGEAGAALNGYIGDTGREGEHYRDALGLLLTVDEHDEAEWEIAAAADRPEAYAAYLKAFPAGRHAEEAEELRLAAVASAREARERLERDYAIGRRFRDCPQCPEMVVVPPGTFNMGAPATEEGTNRSESPVHPVTIAERFAVGVYEVTYDEWEACLVGGGCDEYRPGGKRGRHPVRSVNWSDKKNYLAWLRERTGKRYRLLSEAEWEYVARAGTATPYDTGTTFPEDRGNFSDNTVPVGSFPANNFGLHDLQGNVSEWVSDCYYDDYVGAPSDGSSWWKEDRCGRMAVRGSNYADGPNRSRSAYRHSNRWDSRNSRIGIRVALSLIE